ncbi:hypothetical protein FE783_00635 [Paenibacillus mesophilus]|uniref:hypothetical protein n=1 Tax=Paenibacillus mesophilus TaxID=2582849 RepID=UPI00110E718A|nr:hypothetical protein [Paenibacillus mesophilus]TMV52737.1 hypothetical protein FE783_00635 [Paenibacillus mesophilus]
MQVDAAPAAKPVPAAAAIVSAVAVDFITRKRVPKIGAGKVNVPAAVTLYVLPVKNGLPVDGNEATVAILLSTLSMLILPDAFTNLDTELSCSAL